MKQTIMVGNRLLFLILLLTGSTFVFAQKPYWQQRVDTKIWVSMDDENHYLRGSIEMNYVNHSPDTLSYIEFHLYPNAYQNDRTAYDSQAVENGQVAFYFSSEKDRGGIDSLNFEVDGRTANFNSSGHLDEGRLYLPKPLLPGDSTQISTPFRVKIPKLFSRLGHVGQSYQISQWFPKPAVYDAQGWHNFPYLDQGEFYSEFGDYDVWITVPKNYVLMATGNLKDAPDEQKWLDELAQKPFPSDTLYKNDFPTSSAQTKTLHFQEKNVHDFAWFADKRWILRKDKLQIDGRDITVYRCFLPQHQKSWAESQFAVKTAMETYSQAVGPYLYKTVKVVDGALSPNAGGMEYPTIAIIAPSLDKDMINVDIVHEVGHNWFYGMLASNERAYPWMDEGINSFYEQKIIESPGKIKGRSSNQIVYNLFSGLHELQPADTQSSFYPEINYGLDIYVKVPLLLNWLEAYMGKDDFQKAMQDYYRQFKLKHPQPQDFERIFKNHTTKDIDWFFEAMATNKPIDFSVSGLKNEEGKTFVSLKNKTDVKGPVLVTLKGKDEQGNPIDQNVWSEPFLGKTKIEIPNPPNIRWTFAQIDSVVPDFNRQNDANKSPLAIRGFFGLNDEPRHPVWISPIIGYNYYDGFMVGLGFHDLTLPQNKFQFGLAPLFGTKSKRIQGTGFLSYTWFQDQGGLHDITLKVEGKAFDYLKSNLNSQKGVFAGYQKVAPELVFNFRKAYPRSPVEKTLSLKGYWIREESMNFTMGNDSLYRPSRGSADIHLYGKARFNYEKRTTFNPFGYGIEGQIGKDFAKLSITAHLKVDYFLENKGLHVRGYFGKMFGLADDPMDWYRYQLTATYSGINDYLYDETVVARNKNTGFFANQIAIQEGGMKVNTLQYASPVGLSDNWLGALNLETDLPIGKIPIRIFGDLAAFPKSSGEGSSVIFEMGFSLHLGSFATLYAPVVMSKELNDYTKSVLGKNRFLKTLSFSLNLNEIPWTKITHLVRDFSGF